MIYVNGNNHKSSVTYLFKLIYASCMNVLLVFNHHSPNTMKKHQIWLKINKTIIPGVTSKCVIWMIYTPLTFIWGCSPGTTASEIGAVTGDKLPSNYCQPYITALSSRQFYCYTGFVVWSFSASQWPALSDVAILSKKEIFLAQSWFWDQKVWSNTREFRQMLKKGKLF